MRFFFIFIFLSSNIVQAHAQPKLNLALKKELDSMFTLDQKYRKDLSASIGGKADSLTMLYGVKKEELTNHLWKLQGEIDSLNTVRVEDILKQYGYPGKSLVGSPTNEAAFYIIQHSKVIDKYLPLVKKAANDKELRFELYAMMLDRHLMFQDKEQVYGTQGTGFSVKNPATGKWEPFSLIWPIKDPARVNERRKTAGFKQTVEESAKEMGITYRIYPLNEVLKKRNEIMQSSEN